MEYATNVLAANAVVSAFGIICVLGGLYVVQKADDDAKPGCLGCLGVIYGLPFVSTLLVAVKEYFLPASSPQVHAFAAWSVGLPLAPIGLVLAVVILSSLWKLAKQLLTLSGQSLSATAQSVATTSRRNREKRESERQRAHEKREIERQRAQSGEVHLQRTVYECVHDLVVFSDRLSGSDNDEVVLSEMLQLSLPLISVRPEMMRRDAIVLDELKRVRSKLKALGYTERAIYGRITSLLKSRR